MRLLYRGKDGGQKSTVNGFWVLEIKFLFSIVFLCFEEGSREVYHSHAFNGLTWWLTGEVDEHLLDGTVRTWTPSWKPKFTPRSCFHKVYGKKRTWALSLRGPWKNTWHEYLPETKKFNTLTHGRVCVQEGDGL